MYYNPNRKVLDQLFAVNADRKLLLIGQAIDKLNDDNAKIMQMLEQNQVPEALKAMEARAGMRMKIPI